MNAARLSVGLPGAAGAAPMATSALTRRGCSAATISDGTTPAESPTSAACSMPSASSTAMASPAISASAYAAASSGLVGAAVAARVEGHAAAVAGEVRHLRLPLALRARSPSWAGRGSCARPRRTTRRRRARRRARRARPVGLARADGRSAATSSPAIVVRHGRASSTMLNGVSVARRKRVKPARRDDVAQARLAGLGAERRARPPATATPACRRSVEAP